VRAYITGWEDFVVLFIIVNPPFFDYGQPVEQVPIDQNHQQTQGIEPKQPTPFTCSPILEPFTLPPLPGLSGKLSSPGTSQYAISTIVT